MEELICSIYWVNPKNESENIRTSKLENYIRWIQFEDKPFVNVHHNWWNPVLRNLVIYVFWYIARWHEWSFDEYHWWLKVNEQDDFQDEIVVAKGRECEGEWKMDGDLLNDREPSEWYIWHSDPLDDELENHPFPLWHWYDATKNSIQFDFFRKYF